MLATAHLVFVPDERGREAIGQRTNESQEPVHKLMPSLLTPKQLTRFSWPTREPTFSPLVISQTCEVLARLRSAPRQDGEAYLALKVVVACEQESAGDGRSDRGNTTQDGFGLRWFVSNMASAWCISLVTYTVDVELPVGTDIEKAAGCVVGAGDEGVAIGEELDGVDVGLVTCKSLHSLACSDVPKLGESVASTGDKSVLICWVEADAHHIAQVISELDLLRAGLDIPLHASHVAGGGQYTPVVDETAAG